MIETKVEHPKVILIARPEGVENSIRLMVSTWGEAIQKYWTIELDFTDEEAARVVKGLMEQLGICGTEK